MSRALGLASRSKKRLVLLGATVALLAGPGVALAYYTTLGAGSGVANVGSLSAPTLGAPTPGAGTASLSWTAVAPPQADTVTYTVSRGTGEGAVSGTCTGSLSGTTCTDSGLAAGTYHYTVTAHWRTWSATSASQSVTLASGALDHFELVLASPQVDGVAFTGVNTLTAKDAAGITVASFDASADNVTIRATSPLTGAVSGIHGSNVLNLAGDFTSGVADLTTLGMTYTGNVATGTFTATAASGKAGTSGSVQITAGSVSQLVFTTQPGGAVAGVPFTQQPVVTAKDAGGNAVTGYAGTVALAIKPGTGSGGTLIGCGASLSGGVATFSGCRINAVGAGYGLTASDGTRSVDSSAFDVTLGYNVPLFQAVGPATTFGLLSSDTNEVVQYPTGHAAGDLLFLVACVNQENGNPFPGSFGAWTRDQDSGPIKATAANSMHCAVYHHVAAAGETSVSILVKAGATSAAGGEAWVIDYRKPSGTPLAAGTNTDRSQAGTSATFSPAAVALSPAPANEIHFVVNLNATSLALSTPGGFALDTTSTVTPPGTGALTVTLGVASAIRATTGTPATPTWTGAPYVWYADFAPWY